MSKICLYWHVIVACAALLAWPLEAAEDVPKAAPETLAEDPQNAATHYFRAAEFLPEVTWEERKQMRDALEKLEPDACASLLDRDADEIDEADQDLVAQIRGLPKGSTRKIANQLILAVAIARKKECELEQLSESLRQAFQDRGEGLWGWRINAG